jgi:hypothetical protein
MALSSLLSWTEKKKQIHATHHLSSLQVSFSRVWLSTHGAAHQHVDDLLSELRNKALSPVFPTAFNFTNFISYAIQRLSILLSIAPQIIKHARVIADPSSTSTFS